MFTISNYDRILYKGIKYHILCDEDAIPKICDNFDISLLDTHLPAINQENNKLEFIPNYAEVEHYVP